MAKKNRSVVADVLNVAGGDGASEVTVLETMPDGGKPVRDESKILRGDANSYGQGSWVRSEQGTQKNYEGVSQIWAKQCLSPDQFKEKLLQDEDKLDAAVSLKSLGVDTDNGQFKIEHDGKLYDPSPTFLNDLIDESIGGGGGVLSALLKVTTNERGDVSVGQNDDRALRLARDLVAYAQDNIEGDRLVRFDTETNRVRGFVSTDYTKFDTTDLLRALKECFGDEFLVSHYNKNKDFARFNILLPNTIRDYNMGESDYGAAVAFRNGEIGNAGLEALATLFRALCANGCFWGRHDADSKYNRRHTNIEYGQVVLQLRSYVDTFIPLMETNVRKFVDTQRLGFDGCALPYFVALYRRYANATGENKLGVKELAPIMRGYLTESQTSDPNTAFTLINGVTRGAQDPSLNPRRYTAINRVGAKFAEDMMADDGAANWRNFVESAKSISAKEVSEAFKAAPECRNLAMSFAMS